MIYKIYSTLITLIVLIQAQSIEIIHENNYSYVNTAAQIFFGQLRNNSDQDIEIDVFRKDISLPNGWETSYCVGNCYPPMIDSVRITLRAGETMDNFTMDFLEIEEGQAEEGEVISEIVIRNLADKSEISIPFGITYAKEERKELTYDAISASFESQLSQGDIIPVSIECNDEPEFSLSYVTEQDDWDLILSSVKPKRGKYNRWIKSHLIGTQSSLLRVDMTKDNAIVSRLIRIIPGDENSIIVEKSAQLTSFSEKGLYKVDIFSTRGQLLESTLISHNEIQNTHNSKQLGHSFRITIITTPSGKKNLFKQSY